MGYIQRRVLFYQLQVKRSDKKGMVLGNELYRYFKLRVRKYIEFKEEDFDILSHKLLDGEEDSITIDVIDYDENFAFCRMGRSKDINSYHKRDRNSLQTEKIILKENQYIEVFTYFLLDFNNGIISHVFGKSAPGIKIFEYFFDNMRIKGSKGNRFKLSSEIVSIPNDDAIELMKNIQYFSGMEAKFAIPAKEFFDELGVDIRKSKYMSLAKMPSETIMLTLQGGNQRLKENDYKDFNEVITELYGYRNDNLVKLNVKVNINEQRVENISLLDEKFNRQISIKQELRSTYIPIKNIKKELEYIYTDVYGDLNKRIETTMI